MARAAPHSTARITVDGHPHAPAPKAELLAQTFLSMEVHNALKRELCSPQLSVSGIVTVTRKVTHSL